MGSLENPPVLWFQETRRIIEATAPAFPLAMAASVVQIVLRGRKARLVMKLRSSDDSQTYTECEELPRMKPPQRAENPSAAAQAP